MRTMSFILAALLILSSQAFAESASITPLPRDPEGVFLSTLELEELLFAAEPGNEPCKSKWTCECWCDVGSQKNGDPKKLSFDGKCAGDEAGTTCRINKGDGTTTSGKLVDCENVLVEC